MKEYNMKANDTQIFKFLEGSKQFMVPLFQRTFSWKEQQIRRFWEDIEDTKNGNETTHFFGSFVTIPFHTMPSAVPKYLIVDGQQRLITISVFLSALRKRIIEIDQGSKMKDEIYEGYLVNKWSENPEDTYKVVPTQADCDIFFSIIEKSFYPPDPETRHLIIGTWRFFEKKLSKSNDLAELRELKETLLRKFSVVDISLEKDEDPYLIFESLNAKGSPLTQSDLVRNYLFMRIKIPNQQKVYDEIWFPMQQQLRDNLEAFLRHYQALNGSIPSFRKIYATFKEYMEKNAKSEDAVIEVMKELARFSNYYSKFLFPEKEKELELRNMFKKIRRLEITTCYPLLLSLYEDYANGRLSIKEFLETMRTIETYIVRRAVCGIPTAALNRFFPRVYKNLKKSAMVDSLKTLLKNETGTTRMPGEDEFKRALEERNLYGNKILRFLLEEIERHDNKELVNFSELQIEHIMPETLSKKWKDKLGANWELIYKKYLHTLGNLTLTGYNQNYYNKTFIEKRDLEKGYKESNLKLNRNLAKLSKWTEQEINDRAQLLANNALNIWNL